MTIDALTEADVEQLPLDHRARSRLAAALHQRRRCLARWHATAGVVDRSDGSGDPRLRSVLAQVGVNNYQLALDCCAPTFVLLQLGPDRGGANLVLVDEPAYAGSSALADYAPDSLRLGEAQRQAAALRRLF